MLASENQQLAGSERSARSIGSRVQIVLLAIGGAVTYGIIQDQVTARVCVEYFTIGHYDYWKLQDPMLLAFEWGLVATWWVGLILGMALAICAQAGRRRPPLMARDLLRPMLILLACTGFIALLAGVVGYILAQNGAVYLIGPLSTLVPKAKHHAFLADLWTHNAAYLVGFIGGIVICIRAGSKRRELQQHIASSQREERVPSQGEKIVLLAFTILGGVSLALGMLFIFAVNNHWIM